MKLLKTSWIGGLVIAALLLPFSGTFAEANPSLYEEELSILNRSETERNDGFSLALSRVLTRLTGALNETDNAALRPIVDAAPAYVEDYAYRERNGLRLWVRFDEQALQRALRSAGITYSDASRDQPTVLLWIGVQEDGDRMWLEPEYPPAAARAVQSAAQRAAIPVIFPLFDLEDLGQVKLADLIAGVDDPARASLAKYGAQSVLVASAIGSAGQWQVDWRYYPSGQPAKRWSSQSSSSLSAALEEGILKLKDSVASIPAATAEPTPPRPAPVNTPRPPAERRTAPQNATTTPSVFGTLPIERPSRSPARPFPPPPRAANESTQPAPVNTTEIPLENDRETSRNTAPLPPESGILLVVTGIESLEDYAKLDHYLRGISLITAHRPQGLGAGKAVFRIETSSNNRQELEQQLVLDGQLRSVSPWESGAGAEGENALYLTLVK